MENLLPLAQECKRHRCLARVTKANHTFTPPARVSIASLCRKSRKNQTKHTKALAEILPEPCVQIPVFVRNKKHLLIRGCDQEASDSDLLEHFYKILVFPLLLPRLRGFLQNSQRFVLANFAGECNGNEPAFF